MTHYNLSTLIFLSSWNNRVYSSLTQARTISRLWLLSYRKISKIKIRKRCPRHFKIGRKHLKLYFDKLALTKENDQRTILFYFWLVYSLLIHWITDYWRSRETFSEEWKGVVTFFSVPNVNNVCINVLIYAYYADIIVYVLSHLHKCSNVSINVQWSFLHIWSANDFRTFLRTTSSS